MKVLQKIDKFFPLLLVAMLLLASLTIFTFKGIFSAVNTAYETEQDGLGGQLRIDRNKLGEATRAVFERESIPLEVTE
jgi:hypothetical protein